mgnify:CR=1 FL=1
MKKGKPEPNSVSAIKTGSFERRLALTKIGLLAGSKMAGQLAGSVFSGKEKRAEKRKIALSEQAQFIVAELGKLKGSVVKIGQVMALYGEHFLPTEVTEALHTLEENTTALDWPVIREVLFEQLGPQAMSQLDVEHTPIGSASLGQVHRATILDTGKVICLKVQYPGVAQAIDVDLNAVAQILKLARIVTFGPAFDDWLEEVRTMMHREVDYVLEAKTTERFARMLEQDSRYIVPSVYWKYSTARVMATSFEQGENVSSERVANLSQERRNLLGKLSLTIFLQELFEWGEIQTDPNFGNYRIRIDDQGEEDKIVLLDFGAVQKYPSSFIDPVCNMISSAYYKNVSGVIKGGIALKIMNDDWPESILTEFAEVCIAVLEPLASERNRDVPHAYNTVGDYCWKGSDLPTRIAKRAAKSAISRYFKIPPKEFVFLNRKLVGVYTFISVLDGEFNGKELLIPFLDLYQQKQPSQ